MTEHREPEQPASDSPGAPASEPAQQPQAPPQEGSTGPAQEDPGEPAQKGRGEPAKDPVEHERYTAGRASKTLQQVTIALLVLGLLTVIFILQNTQSVQVHFLFFSAQAPLAAAILLAAVLGGILTFLVAFLRQRQYRRAARKEHGVHSG